MVNKEKLTEELQNGLESEAQRIYDSITKKEEEQLTGKITFTQKFKTFNVITTIELIHEIKPKTK